MDEERVSVYSTDNRESLPVYPQDILHPTDKGEAEIHGGATRLPAEMLELLVQVDGKVNVGESAAPTATSPNPCATTSWSRP